MKNYTHIIMGLALVCGSQTLWANQPSSAQIVQWIKNIDASNASPERAIKVDETKPVTLYSGEKAYLSAVTYENSGRNFWGGYILTRPQLRQSQILEFGGQSNTFRIHSIYKNEREFDLIEFESESSGQGEVSQSLTLTYINNWQVKELWDVESGSFAGRYKDELNDVDCKTGYDHSAFINLLPFDGRIVETTVKSNACDNKTNKDYKVTSQVIELRIP